MRRAFAEGVANIQGDHYVSEVLRAYMRRQSPSSADVDDILRLTASVDSDHYRGEVLGSLLELGPLRERDLLAVIDSATKMSDHYESETLRKVLRHASTTDRVRAATLAAADALGRHYGDEVRRAARR
ncbi:MAG: hypothetical protein M3R55_14955 [Acidobacteriota bacterium]|nr:hypothetical protein [Acidobacteriota bacterium]